MHEEHTHKMRICKCTIYWRTHLTSLLQQPQRKDGSSILAFSSWTESMIFPPSTVLNLIETDTTGEDMA